MSVWRAVLFDHVPRALKSVPEQALRGGAIGRAPCWQKFVHITLPMMRNIIADYGAFSLIVTFATSTSFRS